MSAHHSSADAAGLSKSHALHGNSAPSSVQVAPQWHCQGEGVDGQSRGAETARHRQPRSMLLRGSLTVASPRGIGSPASLWRAAGRRWSGLAWWRSRHSSRARDAKLGTLAAGEAPKPAISARSRSWDDAHQLA